MVGLILSENAYICGMDWRAKQLVTSQTLSPVAGGLYEGQLVVWDAPDAHNDVFTRQTKFHIYGEPPVYLEHNYFAPPVGKIVHFSDREDGLYVALKLERPLEDVSGIHLSVGGFAIGGARQDGAYEIKEFAVFEASLTPTPAQPNSELVLLMKTLTDMATENEKAPQETAGAQAVQKEENVSVQATQKVATAPSALGYLRKQDLAQLEAFVNELAARVEALETLQAQVADLQQRVADLAAAVSQIQGMTQEAVAQSVEKALKAVEEQVQPLAKELAKTMLLVSEALKKTNTQRI
jgi:polyhydroxyalkanoate synthesis regulator phasin